MTSELETSRPRRVVKLGGSLLDLPDLAARLRHWLQRQSEMCTLLVAGGGRLADVLRDADRLHRLGEKASHWLCIRAMTIHAEMLAALLPEAQLLVSIAEWRSRPATLSILDPWVFLREEERRFPGPTLPESWQATSDSIAARIALCVDAAELVLLKSKLPQHKATLSGAAAAGFVAPLLPQFGSGLPAIRSVNLRSDEFLEIAWRAVAPL